jgi:diguanylate cyclase (GGDEF)-like protein
MVADHVPHRDLRAAQSRVAAGVLLFDSEQGVIDANQAWTETTDLNREQTLGTGWLLALAPHSRASATAQLHRAARGGDSSGTEWELAAPSRVVRRVEVVAQRLPPGAESAQRCVVAMVDVTHVTAREAELVYAATHDALSGLLNRAAFDTVVAHALAGAARRSSTVAVLFIDLDGFKSVNDAFGHRVGDDVLVAASDRLRSVVRPNDTVARVGGDEFVILCEDVHRADDAIVVARRVVEVMACPFVIDGQHLQLAASVGVALAGDTTTTSLLVQDADRAMYRAKDLGRGQVAVGAVASPPRPNVATEPRGTESASESPVSTCVQVLLPGELACGTLRRAE